jgi:hypothetical protein
LKVKGSIVSAQHLRSRYPVVRTNHLICEELSGECVVYDGRNKRAHHLNSTLTWIWHRCDGNTSIEALAAAFETQFNVTNGLHVLMTGLEQLEARDLLETPLDIPDSVIAERAAVSRRSVVVGGSVLMPLVVSILAPTPAAASSNKKEKASERQEKPKKR